MSKSFSSKKQPGKRFDGGVQEFNDYRAGPEELRKSEGAIIGSRS